MLSGNSERGPYLFLVPNKVENSRIRLQNNQHSPHVRGDAAHCERQPVHTPQHAGVKRTHPLGRFIQN